MFTFLIEYWKENFIDIVKIKRIIILYIFHRAKTPAIIKKIVII
jgi:hypothetical protein